ncbi:MAG TPA: transcriptional regulator [Blastocatellia bacterium]|nr:transcriptional regulator [Blastocatellia bacterium]
MENERDLTVEINSITYSHQECAWCEGTGYNLNGSCAACSGKGVVFVAQPARKCPHCAGSGKESQRTMLTFPRCAVCLGTGWALALR